MTILNQIKAYKLQEIESAKREKTIADLYIDIKKQMPTRGFLKALQDKKDQNMVGLIAEIKKASPSKGLIRADFDVTKIAQAYQDGGACCLSILTDSPSFQGHDDFLIIGRNAVNLPVLRKDFMFDPYQIIQSRSMGADCILIIMACLSDTQAVELEQAAFECDMDVLIETHNQDEMERALTHLKSNLIGINNRNLHSFVTDLSVSEALIQMVPSEKLCVSESGIFTVDDIKELQKHDIHSFLIGESLMRQENIYEATKLITDCNL
ncbi:MAG: indole-3-glycerol phosphate synthase [Alphaproteobacteria bacterium]|jgi:indole-3-glycerol phosphate synthase